MEKPSIPHVWTQHQNHQESSENSNQQSQKGKVAAINEPVQYKMWCIPVQVKRTNE